MDLTVRMKDFEARTNLPSIGTEDSLGKLGARHMVSDPFSQEGVQMRIDFMLLKIKREGIYVWKKFTVLDPAASAKENSNYQIHQEIYSQSEKDYPVNMPSKAVA